MAESNTQKNTFEGSIEAGGNVNLGDQKTINVYGVPASSKDIQFVIKFFLFLMGLFAISSIVFLVFNPANYIASFAAGGFFVLLALLIVVLAKIKRQAPINIK